MYCRRVVSQSQSEALSVSVYLELSVSVYLAASIRLFGESPFEALHTCFTLHIKGKNPTQILVDISFYSASSRNSRRCLLHQTNLSSLPTGFFAAAFLRGCSYETLSSTATKGSSRENTDLQIKILSAQGSIFERC